MLKFLGKSVVYELDLKERTLVELFRDLKVEVDYSSFKKFGEMFNDGYYFKKEFSPNHLIIRGWTEFKYYDIEMLYLNNCLSITSYPHFSLLGLPIIIGGVLMGFGVVDSVFFLLVTAPVIMYIGLRITNNRVLAKFDKDLRLVLHDKSISFKKTN